MTDTQFTQLIESWKDPQKLRRDLKKFGLSDALLEAAKEIAAEWYQERQLPPTERVLRAQLRELQDQHETLLARQTPSESPTVTGQ